MQGIDSVFTKLFVTGGGSALSSPIPLSLVLVLLAMVPMLLLACTCMLKFSVVLSIFRSALGAGQIPSAPIATLLSIVLSFYVMQPVFLEMYGNAQPLLSSSKQIKATGEGKQHVVKVFEPLITFMSRHAGESEIEFFLQMRASSQETGQVDPKNAETNSLQVLLPAFVLSQLREALILGCAIFFPFLLVDLVVANLLVGLGMMMVSPAQIALPLKLLLFTLCDGWVLLSRSLILTYQG